MNKVKHPFWVIVHKEIADHVHSLRFIILISIIVLTCMGALYTALTNIGAAIKPDDPDGSFLFLKLFTVSDGTLPSFVLFINFLGPLLGIALGFDAVNSEQNKGTLSRMLAQPIHRDCIINAKFVAALIIYRCFIVCTWITGDGVWIDRYWHSSYAGRVLEDHPFYYHWYFLCGILVEYIYFVFSLLSSSCNFCVGFGCSLVVFQRVLCNDSQCGGQGVESIWYGVCISSDQLSEIHFGTDAVGTK